MRRATSRSSRSSRLGLEQRLQNPKRPRLSLQHVEVVFEIEHLLLPSVAALVARRRAEFALESPVRAEAMKRSVSSRKAPALALLRIENTCSSVAPANSAHPHTNRSETRIDAV
jgi:hypothetical protein